MQNVVQGHFLKKLNGHWAFEVINAKTQKMCDIFQWNCLKFWHFLGSMWCLEKTLKTKKDMSSNFKELFQMKYKKFCKIATIYWQWFLVQSNQIKLAKKLGKFKVK